MSFNGIQLMRTHSCLVHNLSAISMTEYSVVEQSGHTRFKYVKRSASAGKLHVATISSQRVIHPSSSYESADSTSGERSCRDAEPDEAEGSGGGGGPAAPYLDEGTGITLNHG